MSDIVTQKEFYEAVQELKDQIHQVTNTMTKTTTLIRDYNGLRKTIGDVDIRVQTLEDNQKNKKNYREYIAWLVALVNTLLAIFMAIK
ncbi:hypothetical protein [Vallitalea sp.]|jgi:uncharacterized protein YpuA (DUF1002 family)|uniref:hypothetical protein n=1 Tax=Vallitalea sp. TaxID=1882829 RepID=UPI0025CD9EBD|nr:hypothetical protein [Vallitalea sp.]MCT4686098.1 hypothetical protein [Vallitalea sp.]